ncbi:MAG: TIGR02302 family protein [Xanthobacteraceae bacterium]
MTEAILPDKRSDRAGDPSGSLLASALKRARWTIFWERLWPPLAALATLIGLFLTVSWLGVWLWLPPLARAAGLIAFAVVTVAACVPFIFLRMPGAADSLKRLDRVSGLAHRPATAIGDELAISTQDLYSLALWNAHVERARQAARSLKAGLPAPRLAWRDPYALRGLVLLACVATFVAAGGERIKRIAAAFDWHGVVLPANFRVDAWVIPPLYTGKPPVILPGLHPGGTFAQLGGPMSVPVNSTLVVRATGDINLDVSASGGLALSTAASQAPAGTEEHRFVIKAAGAATLRGVGDDVTWAFNAIPDKPPTIALTKDPQEERQGALLLSYRLEDDYGVTKAEATFALKAVDMPAHGEIPRPLFGAPQFALILPQERTRNGVGQTIKDLTSNPWAGAEVTMTLAAHDDGGNIGKSEPFTFQLPERVFTKPLARALVEQRRILALDANTRQRVLTALDALAIAPDKFMPDPGVYLGLREIYWQLVRAKTDDDLRGVTKRLWQMAVDIEDGNVADAQASLRNAEEALRQALQNGASDQQIKQLMDKLRQAMNRYMEALAQQLRNNGELSQPLDRNAQVLSQRDLNNLLNRLENLARSGSRTAAQELLSQLQQMMENLQMASPKSGGDQDSQMQQQLDALGDLIRRQQDLRDRTYKQGQAQHNQNAPGQQGQQGQNGQGMGQLQHNQQALRDRLNKLLEELKKNGSGHSRQSQQGQGQGQQGQSGQDQDGTNALGRAGKNMGEAAGELGNSDADSAVESQGRALDALRKGAQSMAQAMQQQMGRGQGQGRLGRVGQSRSDQETDPLGRPLRGHEYSDDDSVKVPGDIDVQRARRIIEELRKRYSDMKRPQQELDYLDRLLKNY